MLSRNKSVIGFVVELTRAAENMQPRSSNRNLIRNADPEDTDTQWLIAFLMVSGVSGGLLIVGAGGEGVLDALFTLPKR